MLNFSKYRATTAVAEKATRREAGFVLIALLFYYSWPLLSRNSKYETRLIRRTCAPRRACFIETLIVADVWSIKIFRSFEFIVFRLDIRRPVMVWCAQADKILSFLFVFGSKKFDVIQLLRTQIRVLVNNYMQRGVRAWFHLSFYVARRTGKKHFIRG